MTTDAPDGRADPIDVIFRSLDDSGWGRRNLPKLVSLLDHDGARVRLGAGWAITYVAEEHPDSAEYLVRRLGDRMTEDEVPLAVEQTFFGVAARHPDVVEAELPDVVESETTRQFERDVGGSMLRADYAGGGGGSRNSDVGRVRMPRGADGDDEQQIFTNDGEENPWRADSSDGTETSNGDDGAGGSDDGEGDDNALEGPRGRPARELWAETDHLARIATQCLFDDLAVMSERRRGRYADVYRLRAALDEEEFAASLLLFRTPDERADEFVADLDEALGRWGVVDDVDGIRTLHDWGWAPRPWALVEYADGSLRQRGGFSTGEALWNARHLAASLAHAHENGVVHAGVDPGNVSYHENLLDPEERQIPMLTNVGVLSVVRNYFDPTARLDPRFAAPEYFDRRFGRIDHASDVYGLGALCYLLFTGQPPYRGDYASVRDAVLSPTTPTPSAVADVPAELDEIVGKAMATEKLHRYEAVTHMAADLRTVARRDDIGKIYESYPRAADTGGGDEPEATASAGGHEDGAMSDDGNGDTDERDTDERDGDDSDVLDGTASAGPDSEAGTANGTEDEP